MGYYLMWIPCFCDNSVEVIKGEVREYNISDTDVSNISASIDRRTLDIVISYVFKEKKQHILLKLRERNESGFLLYGISDVSENESELAKIIKNEVHPGIYHVIKEFFHEHTFHTDNEDSILHARFFPFYHVWQQTNQGQDNDVNFFITEYYDKFESLYNDINEKKNALLGFKENLTKYRDVYCGNKRLLDLINRFMGESLYFDYLANLSTGGCETKIEKIKVWRDILSIQKENIENQFNFNTAIYGTKVSMNGLIIGVIGFFVSLISLFVSCR